MVDETKELSKKELIAGLRAAVNKIVAEQKEARESYEARQADLLHREEMVRQAIDGLNGRGGRRTSTSTKTPSAKRGIEDYSISDERFRKVVEYLERHPRSRQVDITKQLKLNSGTVSVALRKLEKDGKIKKGEREEKNGSVSRIWEMPEATRETVVTPGQGVRKGRRRSSSKSKTGKPSLKIAA